MVGPAQAEHELGSLLLSLLATTRATSRLPRRLCRLVEPVRAEHDLDNLLLGEAGDGGVSAEFELEALLLTGMALDTTRWVHAAKGPLAKSATEGGAGTLSGSGCTAAQRHGGA